MQSKQKETVGEKCTLSQLAIQRETNHRANTCGVSHALLQRLYSFNGSEVKLSEISESFCQDFAEYLLKQVRMSSARTYLHKMRALMRYAEKQKIIPSNPMPKVTDLMPHCKSSYRTYLSQDELSRLSIAHCPHESSKQAFLFACQTGLRLSDIETLRWDDVMYIEGKVVITKIQIKTGIEVRVPLNPIAQKLIGNRSPEKPYVFKLMSRSIIASDLLAWAANAEINKHLTFHVSRHTFATLSIAAGVDVYTVSKLCGHTSVKTTEIYAHMVDERLHKGVLQLSDTLITKGYFSEKQHPRGNSIHIKDFFKRIFRSLVNMLNTPNLLINQSVLESS